MIPLEFQADPGSPDKEEAVLEGKRDEKKRFGAGILFSALLHFGMPLALLFFLPTLSPFFGSGGGPGSGRESVIEVTFESAMPSDAEGPIPALEGARSSGAKPEPKGAPETTSFVQEPNSVPQLPQPETKAELPPEEVKTPEKLPQTPPPIVKGEPAPKPPAKDELKEALEKADLALKQSAPSTSGGTKGGEADDPSTSRSKLLSSLSKTRAAAPVTSSGGTGGSGGDYDPFRKALPGASGTQPGNAAVRGGGFGSSLSGDEGSGGEDDGLTRWRTDVIAKVNKYFAANLSDKFLFPAGRFLHVHIYFFPDGTVDRVELRPPSSLNPGKLELDYFEKVRLDIERAQPLPKPDNPQYLEKGVPVRVRSIRIGP